MGIHTKCGGGRFTQRVDQQMQTRSDKTIENVWKNGKFLRIDPKMTTHHFTGTTQNPKSIFLSLSIENTHQGKSRRQPVDTAYLPKLIGIKMQNSQSSPAHATPFNFVIIA